MYKLVEVTEKPPTCVNLSAIYSWAARTWFPSMSAQFTSNWLFPTSYNSFIWRQIQRRKL